MSVSRTPTRELALIGLITALATIAIPAMGIQPDANDSMEVAVAKRNEALTAYLHGNYTQSADFYTAAIGAGAKLPSTFYNAACSAALAGREEQAFAWLDAAIAKGWRKADHLKQDSDLTALHDDPRWAALTRRAERAAEKYSLTLTHAPLRRELLEMLRVDQEVRTLAHQPTHVGAEDHATHNHGSHGKHDASTNADHKSAHDGAPQPQSGHAKGGRLPAHGAHQLEVDLKHTARLKQIIKDYGWPLDSMVGREGGRAAFLLAQHADHDPAFQRRCLKLMESAPEGEVSKLDIGYLTDRVLVNEGKKQIFGTQFWMVDGKLVPRPIADEANLERRRKEAGMISMKAYRRHMGGHSTDGGSHDH